MIKTKGNISKLIYLIPIPRATQGRLRSKPKRRIPRPLSQPNLSCVFMYVVLFHNASPDHVQSPIKSVSCSSVVCISACMKIKANPQASTLHREKEPNKMIMYKSIPTVSLLDRSGTQCILAVEFLNARLGKERLGLGSVKAKQPLAASFQGGLNQRQSLTCSRACFAKR
jgi:hypothetical protein